MQVQVQVRKDQPHRRWRRLVPTRVRGAVLIVLAEMGEAPGAVGQLEGVLEGPAQGGREGALGRAVEG